MTFAAASTAVLDRAAMGRGPGLAVLPLLTGSDADHVGDYAAQLRSRAHRLDVLVGELQDHRRRLRSVWPSGSASDAAGLRLDRTITQLADVTKLIADTAGQLQQAATVLRAAQTGFNQVVSTTTPTVAALMSNPWTRGAATATAVSTTGSLQTYFAALAKIMNALGLDSIGRIFTSLGTVTTDLEKLFSGTATTADRLSAVADLVRDGSALFHLFDGKAATPPAPVLPDLAASGSAAALAVAQPVPAPTAAALDPAAFSTPGTGTYPAAVYPGGATTGVTVAPESMTATAPSTAAWIPVDPATGRAVHAPAPATATTIPTTGGATPAVPATGDSGQPAGSVATQGHAVITTQRGDLTVTLSVPTDRPATFDLHVDTDGPDIDQHIVVGAGGTVTTK